jgi:transcriptional regulator with XRE-family HTH domain
MEAKDYVDAIRKTGMTQSQIAERTGIPQPSISKIERGDVTDVMSKNYRALQALFDEVVPKTASVPPAAASRAKGGHANQHREPRQHGASDKPSRSP